MQIPTLLRIGKSSDMKSFKTREQEREYNELIRERNIILKGCHESVLKQKTFERLSPAFHSINDKISHLVHRLVSILDELEYLEQQMR